MAFDLFFSYFYLLILICFTGFWRVLVLWRVGKGMQHVLYECVGMYVSFSLEV